MESFVETTAQLEGLFLFGTTLMEPILTDAGETLVTYITMDAANRNLMIFHKTVSTWLSREFVYYLESPRNMFNQLLIPSEESAFAVAMHSVLP